MSVEEIAKTVYVSQDHLTRLFRKKYNQTIIAYITDQRIRLAKELIKQGSMSLNAIALAVGYSDYSYFVRVFKKNVGMTPSTYMSECAKF